MNVRRATAIAAAGTMLLAGATGCGGDESADAPTAAAPASAGSSSAAVRKASAAISEWPGPDSGVRAERGKRIVVVTCSPQGAGCVSAAKGATEAGSELGWAVRTIQGDGSPQGWNAAINNAVSTKADGIVLDAVPPALVGDAVAKARAAKIPLVSVFNPDLGGGDDVFAYVRPDHAAQGKAMADWVAADSGGKARVVVVEDNQFPELVQRVKGFTAQLRSCGGCKVVATVSSQIGTMAQKLPPLIVSTLQAHADATYVVSPYDSNATFAAQGVRQAGRADGVKVSGYEGDPQAIDAVRKGDIQAATVADPTEWMGWQAIDELTRAFAGERPSGVLTRWRLITKGNVPTSGTWTGDLDYKAQYRKLWQGSGSAR